MNKSVFVLFVGLYLSILSVIFLGSDNFSENVHSTVFIKAIFVVFYCVYLQT